MMLYKILFVAAVALSSQVVKAKHKGVAAHPHSPELSQDMVPTGVLNKGLNMILPSDYNFDNELDKYINFAVEIGNTINIMFKTLIDMLKMAKTKNRAPGALINPKVHEATLALGKYGEILAKHFVSLFTDIVQTIKRGINYITKLGLSYIPKRINKLIFGHRKGTD